MIVVSIRWEKQVCRLSLSFTRFIWKFLNGNKKNYKSFNRYKYTLYGVRKVIYKIFSGISTFSTQWQNPDQTIPLQMFIGLSVGRVSWVVKSYEIIFHTSQIRTDRYIFKLVIWNKFLICQNHHNYFTPHKFFFSCQ